MADENHIPVKSGWRSSEFWLSSVAVLMGVLLSSGLVPDASPWAKLVGVVASILGALGYTVSRSIVKK